MDAVANPEHHYAEKKMVPDTNFSEVFNIMTILRFLLHACCWLYSASKIESKNIYSKQGEWESTVYVLLLWYFQRKRTPPSIRRRVSGSELVGKLPASRVLSSLVKVRAASKIEYLVGCPNYYVTPKPNVN